MNLPRALCLLIPLTFATACIDESEDSLDVSEIESELSGTNWSWTLSAANSLYGGQVATLNGTTYMVHTGFDNKDLYWRKRISQSSWSNPVLIPGQRTSDQVSLAAFDGYLYMVHNGETDLSAVWFSRFDPGVETWTPNVKLSMTSDTGAPALAAFDGRLWIVGANEYGYAGDYRLWVSTMVPGGTPSKPTKLNKLTQGRVSLAAFANKLYMAYSSGGGIYTMTHAPGTSAATWSAASPVNGNWPGTTTSQGYDPTIAVAAGYLHLVHTRPYSNVMWWTYWNGVNGCSWAPETNPFTPGASYWSPSLTSGGPGLILLRDHGWSDGNIVSYHMWVNEYSMPPPSEGLPQCGGVVGN